MKTARLAASSARATVVVDPDLVVVRGRSVFPALRAAGFRPIYVSTLRGYCLDRVKGGVERTADVVAALEHAGYRVTVEGGDGR